eukprot:2533313-Amphidinium_carterae.1
MTSEKRGMFNCLEVQFDKGFVVQKNVSQGVARQTYVDEVLEVECIRVRLLPLRQYFWFAAPSETM